MSRLAHYQCNHSIHTFWHKDLQNLYTVILSKCIQVNPTLPFCTNLFVSMTEPLLGKGHMLFLYNCNTSQQQPARTTSLLSTYTGGADKSLARPTSRCILFDGGDISFDASLVIFINSTNIPPIMIINRIYETQNLLLL